MYKAESTKDFYFVNFKIVFLYENFFITAVDQ